MKLRREYIGNIILHLAEFGMKALDIWQSTHLLIFESPQMGLGGKIQELEMRWKQRKYKYTNTKLKTGVGGTIQELKMRRNHS